MKGLVKNMIEKIREFCKQYQMLSPRDKVIVGVSGGADSVCLLHVLLELQQEYELSLFVVHINHGIRGKSAEEDEKYVVHLCEKYKLSYYIEHANVKELVKLEKISEEEAGRNIRYRIFEKVYKEQKAHKIAVAHNENDQAETILMNLVRGSGIRGMSGILPQRNEIIRPLLSVSRKEIEDYLLKRKIRYQTDETNFTEQYTRNKIRLRVLDYLAKEVNSNAVSHIAATSRMLREIEEYIKREGENVFLEIVTVEKGKYFLRKDQFLEKDIVLQKQVIQKILYELSGQKKNIDSTHILSVIQLFEKQVSKIIKLPYQMIAKREYEGVCLFSKGVTDKNTESPVRQEIIFYPLELGEDKEKEIYISARKMRFKFRLFKRNLEKKVSIPKNNCTKWFDYDKISNTVVLRNRQPGDYFQNDIQGAHKKLKKYFIEEKIPQEQRHMQILLADGSHVLWIVGRRISEYYRVEESTTTILEVSVEWDL